MQHVVTKRLKVWMLLRLISVICFDQVTAHMINLTALDSIVHAIFF